MRQRRDLGVPFEHIGALIQKFHKLKKEEQKAFQRPPLQKRHVFISMSENRITLPGIIPVLLLQNSKAATDRQGKYCLTCNGRWCLCCVFVLLGTTYSSSSSDYQQVGRKKERSARINLVNHKRLNFLKKF